MRVPLEIDLLEERHGRFERRDALAGAAEALLDVRCRERHGAGVVREDSHGDGAAAAGSEKSVAEGASADPRRRLTDAGGRDTTAFLEDADVGRFSSWYPW